MKTKYWKVRFAQVEEQAGLPLTAIWNFSLPVFAADYGNYLCKLIPSNYYYFHSV